MDKRAIWKGILRIGKVSVPVKLYAAVEDKTIHFRLLHKKDRNPVRQEMIHPGTGEVIPAEAIRHAYATEDGRMVMLSPEELKELEPEASRYIEIIQFIHGATVDHRWYERPYFLGPDGDIDSYLALPEAMPDGVEPLARWVMRNKEYFGVLRFKDRYPVLITLRHTEEVVQLSELEIPTGREADKKELAMAEQLVSAMADTFDLARYRDEYRAQVMNLITAKASGKIIKLEKAQRKKTTRNLKKALEGSLRAAR